jgi:Flp pilus assembly protein TadG
VFIRLRQLLLRVRGQEGAAAVEFAIILPVLLLLTLGALDLGHMYFIDHLITNASREGARFAVKYVDPAIPAPTSAQVSSYVKSTLNYDAFNLDALTVTTSYAGTFPSRIATVTVTANKNWWVLGTLAGFSTKTLTAQTAMNMERTI